MLALLLMAQRRGTRRRRSSILLHAAILLMWACGDDQANDDIGTSAADDAPGASTSDDDPSSSDPSSSDPSSSDPSSSDPSSSDDAAGTNDSGEIDDSSETAEDPIGADDTTGGDSNVAPMIPGVVLLDDGEDGDNATRGQGSGGMLGYWYTFDDRLECDNGDPTGEIHPVPEVQGGSSFSMSRYLDAGVAPPPEVTSETNEFGARFWGGGHSLWGGGLGVALNNQGGALVLFDLNDLPARALRFWGRNASGELQIRVQITDVYSEPNQGLCQLRDQETCSPDMGCLDSPTVSVALSDTWTLIELPLSEFRREGWGIYFDTSVPETLDERRALQLQFWVPATDSFDVWIDNVGFTTDVTQ